MPSGPQKSLQGKAACALSFLLVRAETNVPNMVSVILRSSDGADHEVSELVASASKTIRSLLEDLEGSTQNGLAESYTVMKTCCVNDLLLTILCMQ